MRAQRVRARQVDQFGSRLVESEDPNVALDGNAGIVADPLLEAGQPIEQRALAGIGGSNNRYAGVWTSAKGYLIGRYAYFFGLSHQPLQAKS